MPACDVFVQPHRPLGAVGARRQVQRLRRRVPDRRPLARSTDIMTMIHPTSPTAPAATDLFGRIPPQLRRRRVAPAAAVAALCPRRLGVHVDAAPDSTLALRIDAHRRRLIVCDGPAGTWSRSAGSSPTMRRWPACWLAAAPTASRSAGPAPSRRPRAASSAAGPSTARLRCASLFPRPRQRAAGFLDSPAASSPATWAWATSR